MKSYNIEPDLPAKACIIWMHGLGADANDMMGLAQALELTPPVKHVFLDAPIRPVTLNGGVPMRAWYDIETLAEHGNEDKNGILDAAKTIKKVISEQIEAGFQSAQIFLAGFSQGGAMALFAGLQSDLPLGGIIALSAYLPLMAEISLQQEKSIAIFMAAGLFDPMVLFEFSKKSLTFLEENGYANISFHEYPMEHAVSMEEINDLSGWINNIVNTGNKGGV